MLEHICDGTIKGGVAIYPDENGGTWYLYLRNTPHHLPIKVCPYCGTMVQFEHWKLAEDIIKAILRQREEIITAFIAKYGCGPEECYQTEQIMHNPLTHRWFVERKKSAEIDKEEIELLKLTLRKLFYGDEDAIGYQELQDRLVSHLSDLIGDVAATKWMDERLTNKTE